MEKNKVLLSIVIPVYNAERYLEDCLRSIYKNTTNASYEIIVIDDSSSDSSIKIIDSYAKKHNVKVFKNIKNLGVSKSRNIGIANAVGKYVMFVDADDILTSDWGKILPVLKNSEEDIIFYSQYFKLNKEVTKEILYSYIFTYNSDNIRISGPYSKIFKTSFIKRCSITYKEDLSNGEDMLFNLEAVCRSSKFKTITDSYYIVRHNSESSTNLIDGSYIENEKRFNKYIGSFISDNTGVDLLKYAKIMNNNSIRSLCYRVSSSNNYYDVKDIYNIIRKTFVKNETCSLNIYYLLLKLKLYHFLYKICKKRKSKLVEFEVL